MKEKILKEFNEKFKSFPETRDEMNEFISKSIDEYAEYRIKEALDKVVPEKIECILCEFPLPECDCRGYNQAINQIKSNIDKLIN